MGDVTADSGVVDCKLEGGALLGHAAIMLSTLTR